MKTLYNFLQKHKNDNTIIYEIVGNEGKDERISLAKSNINNLDISEDKKIFFLKQLSFDCGKFSYKDLYTLVNYYINKLPLISNPYNNVFPIYIDDRTYINNIAMFIACLELGYNPALVDISTIKLIDENEFLQNNVFYVCSSGTVKKKFVPLNERELIKTHIHRNIPGMEHHKGKTFYNVTSMSAISGVVASLIYPLLKEMKVVMNNKDALFNNIARYKANYVLLPLNYEEYLAPIYNISCEDYSNLEKIIIGGDYYSPKRIKKLLTYIPKMREDNIIHLYGQTETYLYSSAITINFKNVVSLNLFSEILLADLMLNSSRRIDKSIISNDLKYGYLSFVSVGKASHKLKIQSRPFGKITYNNVFTGDIGYIDEDNNIYILYRKENLNKLLAEFVQEKTGLDLISIGSISFEKKDRNKDFENVMIVNTNKNLLETLLTMERETQTIDSIFKILIHTNNYYIIGDIVKTNLLAKKVGYNAIRNKRFYSSIDNYCKLFVTFLKMNGYNSLDELIDYCKKIIDNNDIEKMISILPYISFECFIDNYEYIQKYYMDEEYEKILDFLVDNYLNIESEIIDYYFENELYKISINNQNNIPMHIKEYFITLSSKKYISNEEIKKIAEINSLYGIIQEKIFKTNQYEVNLKIFEKVFEKMIQLYVDKEKILKYLEKNIESLRRNMEEFYLKKEKFMRGAK